jgi:hypothetical protein
MLTTNTDFAGRLLALTCDYLFKLGKLDISSEIQEIDEQSLPFASLLAHLRVVLRTFPPLARLQGRRKKRSRSPSTCSSQVSKTRKVWDQSSFSSLA